MTIDLALVHTAYGGWRQTEAREAVVMMFRILGPVELYQRERAVALGSIKVRGLLGILLLQANKPVLIDTIIERLWEGAGWRGGVIKGRKPPQDRHEAMQQYVSRLRRVLKTAGRPGWVRTVSGHYILDVDPATVDYHRFHDHVTTGQSEFRAGNLDRAVEELTAGLELWRGRPFTDLSMSWALRQAADLEANELLPACFSLCRAELALGRNERVLEIIRSRLSGYDTDPRLVELRLRVLGATAGLGDLSSYYHDAVESVRQDFGDAAADHLTQVFQDLIRMDTIVSTVPSARVPEHDVGAFHLPREIPSFIGRAEIIGELDEWLTDVDRTDVVVLHGKPGVGKTALAVTWAYRRRDRFPDGALHADLNGCGPGGPTAPEAVLASFLMSSGVSIKDIPKGLEARTNLLRQRLTGRRVLFLLDNAADSAQLVPILRATAPNPVLITSRQRMSLAHHGGHGITVPLLDSDEAVAFLLRDVRDPETRRDDASLRDLAALCGGLPVALCVAGDYLTAGSGVASSEIVRHLRQRQLLDAGGHGDPGFRSIRAVFDMSVQRFAPDLAEFFTLLGLFPATRITHETASAISGWPIAQVERMFDNLVGAHLVDRADADSYVLHDLIYQYAADRAKDQLTPEIRGQAIHRMVDWYLYTGRNAIRVLASEDALVPTLSEKPTVAAREFDDTDSARRWFLAERGNIIGVIGVAAQHHMHEHLWRIVGTFSNELIHHSDPADLVDVHRLALESAQVDGSREAESGILNSLGAIDYRRADYEGAARYFAKALRIVEDIDELGGQAACLYNLGNTFLERGHVDKAVEFYQRSLALATRIGSRETEAFDYHRLGDAYHRSARPDQAAGYLRRALYIRTELGDLRGQAETLAMLGRVCLDKGDLAAAAENCDEAIAIAQRISGRAVVSTALRIRAEIESAVRARDATKSDGPSR